MLYLLHGQDGTCLNKHALVYIIIYFIQCMIYKVKVSDNHLTHSIVQCLCDNIQIYIYLFYFTVNMALVALMAADTGIKATEYRTWAKSQIHYALGNNPNRQSYVVGFGNNPPTRPHHRSRSAILIYLCTFELCR